MEENFYLIQKELEWLNDFIQTRIERYFNPDSKRKIPTPIDLEDSFYGRFIYENELSFEERVVLALVLAVEVAPDILDVFLTKNKLYDTPFTEFGGERGDGGFVPTVQTALFLLAGDNKVEYIKALKFFEPQAKLFSSNILEFENFDSSKSLIRNKLSLSKNTLHLLLYAEALPQQYSLNFPATLQTTNYEWEDLVLPEYTMEHLKELDMWLKHSKTLLEDWHMSKSISQGYKALFYGSSGTGKTLTASLLGKKFNKAVYRIDLSQVVSKYIGETEKNLEKVFKIAEKEDWILFFDEADSLFGKRTQVSSSNDKYANQETAYLLQRIEECPNLIILATNLKDNFDDAFLRRFQSIIYFPLPDEEERLRLWKNGFSKEADLKNLDLEYLASRYELSGANIINVIRMASLIAIDNGTNEIKQEDVIMGIRREKYKEGKII